MSRSTINKVLEKDFIIVGHRGASAYEVENTLTSIRKAYELGADIVEIDVRLSKDNIPLLFHDDNLKRLTGIDKPIKELTVKELMRLKLKGKEKITLLTEALKYAKSIKLPLFIEIKEEGSEGIILNTVKEIEYLSNVVFISSNLNILEKIREQDKEVMLGYIAINLPIPFIRLRKREIKIFLPRFNLVTGRLIKEAHSKKLKVIAWTINDFALALKLKGLGVDGIATDRPDIKKLILKQRTLFGKQ